MRFIYVSRRTGLLVRLGVFWVILAFLLAGCAHATLSVMTTAPKATSTPAPTHTLVWRAMILPGNVPMTGSVSVAASPVNGNNAWVCEPHSATDFDIWSTHNAAVSWRHKSLLAPAAPSSYVSCSVVADQRNAHALAVVFSWGSGEAGTLRSKSFYSTDDGSHWNQIYGGVQVLEVANVGATTYALLNNTEDISSISSSEFVVSADNLRAWQRMNIGALGAHDSITQFWMGATRGDLLAATQNGLLKLSKDGGKMWTRIPLPGEQPEEVNVAFWLAQSGHWLICDGLDGGSGGAQCSSDLGTTWVAHPSIDSVFHCATCGKGGASYSQTTHCPPEFIVKDGSLLTVCPDSSGSSDQATFTLYRLLPSASAWVALGTAPSPFISVSQTGQLWCDDAQHMTYSVTQLA